MLSIKVPLLFEYLVGAVIIGKKLDVINFSKNDFSSENSKYLKVKEFVEPKEYKNAVTMNSSFYFELGKLMKQNGS